MEEELPILTKQNPVEGDPKDKTSDGLPILKKKEKSELESNSVSSSVSEQDGTPSEKPTEKSTDINKFEVAGDVIKSQSPTAKAIYDFGRRVLSGFTDDIPKAVAQGLEVARSSVSHGDVKEYIQKSVPDKFQNYVREKEGLKWYQPFDQKKYLDQYADSFMRDTGRSDIADKIAVNKPKVTQRRLEIEKFVQEQNIDSQHKMAGSTQSFKQIKNLDDVASYIGTLGGQAAYQIPLSFLTKGASSLLQESATIYDQQLDNLSKDLSEKEGRDVTREEVIKRGLDKPAEGQAYAVLAAALDATSAGNIVGAFKSGGGTMVKKWAKSAIPEATTEAAQGVLEDVGSATGDKGEAFKEAITSSKRLDELAGGLVGGSAGAFASEGKSTPEVITEELTKVDASSPASLEASADAIVNNLEQNQNTIPQPKSEGVEQVQQVTPEEGQSEVQKIIDKQDEKTNVQSESNTGGLQESVQSSEQESGDEKTPITESTSESTEPLRQESEDTNKITDEVQQNTSPEQQEQLPSSELEQPATDGPEISATDQKVSSTLPDQAGKRTYAIAQRITNSDASPEIKRGIKEKGDKYVPKGIDITDSEAKNLIELYGQDRADTLVRDQANGITGDTRTALAARLYESYKQTADQASDPETKRNFYDKAIDIALASAEQLKEAGRAANAAKIWKAITSNEDMTVMAIEKENQKQSKFFLTPIYNQVKRSRQQFDEQIQKLITQKVTEGVEANLKRAKLISSEKRKQITDAFDALKVKDVKGTANDITRVLGSAVWNGSIEAVKRAVLAGADLANAIQAGIDYVRDNHKGDWDEKEYRSVVSPAVEQMVPKDVDQASIDADKIETPKLSGKKKKDFISQVVEAHNDGTLTDEKFEQLYAKQLGAREFTAEDRVEIRRLAKAISDVEQFEQKVKDDFTQENISKYKAMLEQAQRDNEKLNDYARKPNNIWDSMISIMQGNLLTPLSLVTNMYSNIALQPLRFTSTAVGSLVDYSVSKLAKSGLLNESYKDRTIDLAELQKGYFKGNWDGIVEGLKQLKTGPRSDDRNLREINSQFSAVKAIARWADGNRSVAQKANDYVEGTLGVPAEVMFRLLNLGDKPFRRGAETARAMELAKQKGLSGQEMEKFMLFPDAVSQEEITKAGQEATFQQESTSAKFVQEILSKLISTIGKTPLIGGPLKVLAKSQIPYVKTPWNIMVETLQYAAFPVTGVIGIREIAKGNQRAGSVLLGKAVTGAMIFTVAKYLFQLGLLSWDEPYDEDKGKQRERRQIQYDNIPPNSLNVSAIQRGLLGDGFDIKDDDTWINYNKLGVMGLLFDNYSNNYFSNIREKGQMPDQSEFYVDMLTTAPRVVSQSLDQSFLKGTNTLLTALQDGGGNKAEQWLIDTSGALTSIVYPNTLSTISKSADEYQRDVRDDSFVQKLKNTYKTKMFMGGDLPSKVNLWGDKITGQPEGRDKYAYYLFDPTKFKNVDTDNYRYKLYEAWKNDKFNDDFLPSIPQRKISYRKVEIPLDPAMYEKYATYVGQERAKLVSAYINSSGFKVNKTESRIERLKDLYDEGRDRGKKKFLMDTGWRVLTPTRLSQIGKKQ